jgi:carboxyl-terminal processing protease
MRHVNTLARSIVVVFWVSALVSAQQNKDMTFDQRTQVNSALNQISKDVAKHYYDPKLHGVDWDAKVEQTREKVKEEKSLNMAMAHVAALLDSLNDSHTFLIPPRRPYVLDHGWDVQMIGDKCYVIQVRPGGDAETHGVKPGDQLIAINGYRLGRENLWKIEYAFNTLRPLPQLTLTLRSSAGEERKTMLEAKFRKRATLKDLDNYDTIQDLMMEEENWSNEQRIRVQEFGTDLTIVKLKSFEFDEGGANKLISIARKRKTLILDLRENPGGSVEILKLVVGGLFDHDVKLGDRVARDNSKPLVAKTNHHPFGGKVIVLIDSKSASASELLARVVQLEKRGTVIGDRSSGSVMESRLYGYEVGAGGIVTFYGASITDANLLMTDGVSLEHQGVTPDEILLPTAADLAAGSDPVLAHAAGIAGVKLTPEDAGKLFPYQWPTDH